MTFDKEMQAALIADGEKLAALTGEDNGPWDLADFVLPEEHRAELESLAAGYEASDYAESLLHTALKPHVEAFHAGDSTDFTMRQLRISNEARSVATRSRRSAEAIRAVLRIVTETDP
ncbi:hypothetical protein J0664_05970 [Rhizobium leguminosarum]|uniref:hypothetical protein n=1 Tax=Rhizobium leguminosarum TaxID=384 RepID=UPI001A91AD74|nr:hypothetical protein [Rhizobium leguminosarum]MBY5553743.1 hypothetical protein [Rhizobium leguminosarum]QSW24845.1 hypothetical protein J0664_05970 [Rhizobium leguminosarum]